MSYIVKDILFSVLKINDQNSVTRQITGMTARIIATVYMRYIKQTP